MPGSDAEVLEAAARLWAATRYCWLATPDEGGAAHLRPMGRTKPAQDDEEWRLRFVTDGRSRKVAEIWRDATVAIATQRDVDDAFLALRGEATLVPDACRSALLWRDAYAVYFPGEGVLDHAAFLEVRVDRIELWMRSVSPEPFGSRAATLVRENLGGWRRGEA